MDYSHRIIGLEFDFDWFFDSSAFIFSNIEEFFVGAKTEHASKDIGWEDFAHRVELGDRAVVEAARC